MLGFFPNLNDDFILFKRKCYYASVILKYKHFKNRLWRLFCFVFGLMTDIYDDGLIENFEQVWTIDLSEIEMGEVIGKGAFGEVYKGYYFGTEVAIKKLSFMEEDDELYFQREVSALK